MRIQLKSKFNRDALAFVAEFSWLNRDQQVPHVYSMHDKGSIKSYKISNSINARECYVEFAEN